MDLVADDKAKGMQVPIWDTYREIIASAEKSKVLFFYLKNLFCVKHATDFVLK